MIGLHIISDFKGVNFDNIELSENILRNYVSGLIKKYNLSELGNYFHTFSNKNEITGVFALAESHISIHTWPEKKYVSLDIFVCNLGKDNTQKAKKIYEELKNFFNPKEVEETFLDRNF
ncbi:adenosylmethionine decarboxylase [Candidatus Gracilibacteria bacterium]|nr:MAG: adenosylmethionine decarboxylase [Candidatus Gracilibacteria bacterium]PIE85078.1 MAG: adenosylmethionine decarboxylase [Candidatus Gracilibacteria bacterium]